ncbi:Transmembrane receptor, eukaryota [Corchorus olitorius]|uniref:Transmembrane receptor, eukaryota n=1 Tax=Corchorus olitorius TaxID=93759 RepID=A0A1R3JBA2_9ROSI|nr:Transmembrane receptor, eukaryota [Corchorus olitorius]
MDSAFQLAYKNIGVVIFLLLSTALATINASIHIYQNQLFNEVGNAYLLSGGSEGLAASISSDNSATDGRSFIRFENITFWRTKAAADEHSEMEHSTGLIQAVIFEAADRNNIGGSAYGGQRSICCTPDLAKLEGCKQGEVIRIPSATDINWPKVLNIQFSGNYLSTSMDNAEVPITKTGMYNLFFIACDPKLKGTVMSGKTVWKNPDGYLPGRMAPLLKFYVYMAVAYLLLSAIWFSQYMRFWKDILQLQHCITAVIGLGLFEMILWYLEYANFNNTGMRPVVITTWVVTVGAIRKTLSRLLILSVAMGYGVVRPTLGGLTSKVVLLGATYFLASELLDITEYVGTINDISGRARLFLVLPDAFLDAFLILWIFTSLSKTLEQLQAKRTSIKLDLYRKFSNALAVAVIASVAWITYEVYFKATDPFNERWQSAWIITAFWDILAFVLLCVICYLWAPSQSSQRYAYSEDMGEEFDDEEAQSLTRGQSDGDVGLVKQERKNGNAGLSDEEDDSEEDKRE